jgi:hypothetical protein
MKSKHSILTLNEYNNLFSMLSKEIAPVVNILQVKNLLSQKQGSILSVSFIASDKSEGQYYDIAYLRILIDLKKNNLSNNLFKFLNLNTYE